MTLFEQATSFEALFSAARRASRGKRNRPDVANFMMSAEQHCLYLSRALRRSPEDRKAWRPGSAFRFWIRDPKLRLITVVPFADRVVHHALIKVVEPSFERYAIHDSYACRLGKGQLAALRRAEQFARRNVWALKADFASYFDSIPHDRLLRLARRRIRDAALTEIFERIVRAPGVAHSPDRGLPIGALTSQHLANLYLGQVDHWFKDERGVKGYLRYMDDLVAFGNRRELRCLLKDLREFIRQNLGLELNERRTRVMPVRDGVPFLGFRVSRRNVRARPQTARRFRRGMEDLAEDYVDGLISEDELAAAAGSRCGQLAHFKTLALRRNVFSRLGKRWGAGHQRLESGQPGRFLQRSPAERAGRESRQESAFELERQSWFSCRELSSKGHVSNHDAGPRPEDGGLRTVVLCQGADPTSILRSGALRRPGTEPPPPGSGLRRKEEVATGRFFVGRSSEER